MKDSIKKTIAGVLVTITVIIKSLIDIKNWGNVDHKKGIIIAGLIIIPLVLWLGNPAPIFLYGMLFNPVINLIKGLPLFYIGNTAYIDKLLNRYLGKHSGLIFFIFNFIMLCSAMVIGKVFSL